MRILGEEKWWTFSGFDGGKNYLTDEVMKLMDFCSTDENETQKQHLLRDTRYINCVITGLIEK